MSGKHRFKLWFLPLLVAWLQRLFFMTIKKVYVGREHIEALHGKKPWILALWHNNALYSPIIHENMNMCVLVSPSYDGELITRVVQRFGNYTIRGSSSRGGREALKQIVKELRRGQPVAFTPDGPKGPLYQLKPGVVVASQLSGAPIVPFHYECTKQWTLPSWDRHKVPKPFSTMVVAYGTPIVVPADLQEHEYAFWEKQVAGALEMNRETCLKKAHELLKSSS